jgi:fucose 4-O-acetylase-like acetyltransferase
MIKNLRRITYLDVAKAFAMYLVVFGHILVEYKAKGFSESVGQIIYSFHTALFMFLSGYFFQNTLKRDFKTLCVDKSRQLLLPYISWSIICLFVLEIPFSSTGAMGCLSAFVKGGFLHYYWYLKVLFIYIIATWLSVKAVRNIWIGALLVLSFFIIMPDFSTSSVFIPFFVAGFLLRPLIEKSESWWAVLATSIILCVLYFFWSPNYNYTERNNEIIPYVVRTSIGICWSVDCCLVLKKIENRFYNNKTINFWAHIGENTLGIYVCHDLFYRGFVGIIYKSVADENNLLHNFLFSVVVFSLSYMLIRCIKKKNRLALVLLGEKPKV